MEIRIQNTCEELYWETAKKAVAECKLVALGALRLCRSIFRFDEEQALENRYGHLFEPYGEGNVGEKILDRMVAISIPAYGNDLQAIEEMLDDPYHSELNAHYYFQKGRVLVEDHVLPVIGTPIMKCGIGTAQKQLPCGKRTRKRNVSFSFR